MNDMNPGMGVDIAVQGDAAASDDGGLGDMKWAEAVDRWAHWMRSGGWSERTIALRRNQLAHLDDEILCKSPWRVKTHHLTAWMAKQEWKPETRKSWTAALKGFYGWAVEQGYTKRNPAEKLPTVKVPTGLPRPTPTRVIAAAFDRAETDFERLVLMLMVLAGLRRAEVAGLEWAHIEDGVIRVTGKGGRVRLVPMDPMLAAALDQERGRRVQGRFGTGYRWINADGATYVFPGQRGGHVSPDRIGRLAKKLLGTGWTGHTLRHAFLTEIYATTGDLGVTQDLAGHASPATTRIYTRLDVSRLAAAIAARQH